MYQVYLQDGALQDYKALDGSQRKLIDKSLKRIEDVGMQAGEALHGSLAGCRKLKHKKAGLRVVFRESAQGIQIIDIIAIGKRSDSEVYKMAEDRLK